MINRKILYGYQIRDGALEIVPEEQQVVRMVFTLYIAGASFQNTFAAPAAENLSALAVNGWITASCTSNVGPAAVPSPQIRIQC